MSLSLFLSQEQTSRFYYVFSTYCIPLQISRIAFCCYADFLTVYDQLAVFNVSFDSSVELTMHCIVFQHVCQVINRAKVVNTYDLNIASLLSSTENETSDTAETVNTYFNHCNKTFMGLLKILLISNLT